MSKKYSINRTLDSVALKLLIQPDHVLDFHVLAYFFSSSNACQDANIQKLKQKIEFHFWRILLIYTCFNKMWAQVTHRAEKTVILKGISRIVSHGILWISSGDTASNNNEWFLTVPKSGVSIMLKVFLK